ncbi:hypothetical protein NBCG_00600 [Nocardioidaceae bacterium Broad-1]|nr:hypothetical protein NBCG_00600 [Nocardioidaceae bacterium Broad-1]
MSLSLGRQIRASLNLSGSDSLPAFPWLYPYVEDGPRLDQVVHRPIVSTALVGPTGDVSDGLYALVDSGCSHVLAAPWVAFAAGVEPKKSDRILQLGIGGGTVNVRFVDLRVRLIAPGGTDEEFVEWPTEVGFFDQWKPTFPMILGQRGFLDQFTVTMSQFSQATAVEARETFDDRFGIPPSP